MLPEREASSQLAILLATASTDGKLCIWALDESVPESRPISQSRPHQSAVKDIEIVRLSSAVVERETFVILTVGDDNALAVTVISVQEPATNIASGLADVEQTTLVVPRAHAASATAVTVLSNAQMRKDEPRAHVLMLATTSTDQRLRTWEVAVDLSKPGCSGVDVSLRGDMSSAVADASCLCKLTPTDSSGGGRADQNQSERLTSILLCGVGMEHWTI